MTLGECIHGLEIPLCDICFPRKRPEPVRSVRTASARRTAARREPTRVRETRGAASRIDLDGHRVQHVTPFANLERILEDGELRADATAPVDLSSPTTRELRATTELPGGGTAAERVPFYLGPGANRWLQLRAGALGPGWSDAARAVRAGDLVALVAGLGDLGDAVIADNDAAATTTRFASVALDRAAAQRMLGQLVNGQGADDAEVLAPSPVPLSAISLIVVPAEPMRDRVRAALEDVGLRIRVAVNPPWFAVP